MDQPLQISLQNTRILPKEDRLSPNAQTILREYFPSGSRPILMHRNRVGTHGIWLPDNNQIIVGMKELITKCGLNPEEHLWEYNGQPYEIPTKPGHYVTHQVTIKAVCAIKDKYPATLSVNQPPEPEDKLKSKPPRAQPLPGF